MEEKYDQQIGEDEKGLYLISKSEDTFETRYLPEKFENEKLAQFQFSQWLLENNNLEKYKCVNPEIITLFAREYYCDFILIQVQDLLVNVDKVQFENFVKAILEISIVVDTDSVIELDPDIYDFVFAAIKSEILSPRIARKYFGKNKELEEKLRLFTCELIELLALNDSDNDGEGGLLIEA